MENIHVLYHNLEASSGIKIYRALNMGEICLIKALPTSFEKVNSFIYESLKRELYYESMLLNDLNHPNIIKILYPASKGQLTLPNGMYIEADFSGFELSLGGDLISYAKQKVLTEDEIRFYFVQIFDALEYLHSKGIAHCDLKSDNIVLDSTLTIAKLLDFSYSTTFEIDSSGIIRGTEGYIAPEIFSKIPHDPKKSDIFSLGSTLYSLITGLLPCKEVCIQGDPIYKLICEKRFEEFWCKSGNPNISNGLKEVIQNMLHPSSYYRPTIKTIKEYEWTKETLLPAENIVKGMKNRIV